MKYIKDDIKKDKKIDSVDIMGVAYDIIQSSSDYNYKLDGCHGYIELYDKSIVLDNYVDTDKTILKLEDFKDKVLRHELVHGFLHEAGHEKYCDDEILVDCIAILLPRMFKACLNLEIIDY